jgi:hypothetical protein
MGLNATGGAFLSLGVSCCIISGFLVHHEIGEVNRKRPDSEQISYNWMYPGKMAEIKREYKRHYPLDRVEYWRTAFQVAAFCFLALTAIAAGFFK